MSIDYNQLAKTKIFLTDIEYKGKRDKVLYHKYKPDCCLNIEEDSLYLHSMNSLMEKKKKDFFKKIKYSELKEVSLSICRRNYGSIASIIINEYHMDIILSLNDDTSYQLESQSWRMLKLFVDELKQNNVLIKDPLNIYHNYLVNGEKYLEKLDVVFDEIVKQYNINPYRAGNNRS